MLDDLVVCVQCYAEHLAKLVIVRLDEERVIFQHTPQKVLRRIHDNADAAPVEVFHDALIDIVGQGIRNRPCEDEGVTM